MSEDFQHPRLPGGLFLTEIGEPWANGLRLVVAEGIDGVPEMTALGVATPVEVTPMSRRWELQWDATVVYAVRNESYFVPEPGDPSPRDALIVRRSSAILDYVRATTFATDDYPGPLSNWSLYTQHHCIDVVATDAPRVIELKPAGRSAH